MQLYNSEHSNYVLTNAKLIQYSLLFQAFSIVSDFSDFHREISCLYNISWKKYFLIKVVDSCIKIRGSDSWERRACHSYIWSKIISIIMDNALLLDIHIKVVFEKASQKLSALSRLANYLEPEERKLIFNFMIKS